MLITASLNLFSLSSTDRKKVCWWSSISDFISPYALSNISVTSCVCHTQTGCECATWRRLVRGACTHNLLLSTLRFKLQQILAQLLVGLRQVGEKVGPRVLVLVESLERLLCMAHKQHISYTRSLSEAAG